MIFLKFCDKSDPLISSQHLPWSLKFYFSQSLCVSVVNLFVFPAHRPSTEPASFAESDYPLNPRPPSHGFFVCMPLLVRSGTSSAERRGDRNYKFDAPGWRRSATNCYRFSRTVMVSFQRKLTNILRLSSDHLSM